MTKLTFCERLIAGLLAYGWHRDLTNRSKYEAFTHSDRKQKLFVGPNGALRTGECASRSVSIGDAGNQTTFYQSLLAKGTPVKPNFD